MALTVVGVVGVVAIVSIAAPSTAIQEQDVSHTNSTLLGGQTDEVMLSPNTLFTAAATILGFAAFGTPITMAIERKPKRKDLPWHAKIRAFVFLMVVVVLQTVTLLALLFGVALSYFAIGWAFSTGILLIVFVALMILGNSYSREDIDNKSPQQEDPPTTLQRRYINGDITREEFLEMKKDIAPPSISNKQYLFWIVAGLLIAVVLMLAYF